MIVRMLEPNRCIRQRVEGAKNSMVTPDSSIPASMAPRSLRSASVNNRMVSPAQSGSRISTRKATKEKEAAEACTSAAVFSMMRCVRRRAAATLRTESNIPLGRPVEPEV